jgi:hypothetical protein
MIDRVASHINGVAAVPVVSRDCLRWEGLDMEPIQPDAVLRHANLLLERDVYLHFEVNPGGYWRNGKSVLKAIHVKGEGPYRAFLRLMSEISGGEPGLIQVNDVTHMELGDEYLILTGYDDKGRIAQTIEVSLSPFAV